MICKQRYKTERALRPTLRPPDKERKAVTPTFVRKAIVSDRPHRPHAAPYRSHWFERCRRLNEVSAAWGSSGARRARVEARKPMGNKSSKQSTCESNAGSWKGVSLRQSLQFETGGLLPGSAAIRAKPSKRQTIIIAQRSCAESAGMKAAPNFTRNALVTIRA